MTNVFKSAAQQIIKTPFVIVITLAFFLLFIISLGLSYESFMTTMRGYQMLPTAKINSWIIPLVALLPQVGQVAFTYVFAVDTRKRWGIFIAFILHLFDMLTDVYFKAHGQDAWVYILAFFESEILFTLGAVLGLTFSLGMLIELLPHAIEQLSRFFHSISGSLGLHQDGPADDDGDSLPAIRRGGTLGRDS
jgi:hypothetical protein